MTRPRRPGTADPGSDPAWEWGLCWLCGHIHTTRNQDCPDWGARAD